MIVVFGSLNMDLAMRVAKLPQPGETVLCPGYELKPGGKGANQAVAAHRAGVEVAFFGCIGRDDFGSALVENLRREGVRVEGIERVERPTGCATICVDQAGENLIAVASGANLAAQADRVPDSRLGAGTTVLMQMEVPATENWALIARARSRGARTVLNLAPAGAIPAAALEALDVLVANRLEAETVARARGIETGAEPASLVRRLAEQAGCTVAVTLGGEGAVAAQPGGGTWQVGALSIEAVDTTGAGDAFCGVLAAALDSGLGLPEALHRASVGAGLACLGFGAQESLPRQDAIACRLADLAPPQRLF